MKKILKMYLKKGVVYLDPPPNTSKVKQSINADEEGILQWYLKAPQKFKDLISAPPTNNFNIIRLGFYINETTDIMITSANLNLSTDKFRSPCVIHKKYIEKLEEISEFEEEAQKNDICIMYWRDSITNFSLGTIEEITQKSHVADVAKVGFLLQKNKYEAYVSPHHNKEQDKYREVLIVPNSNITKLIKLI